MQSSTPAPQHQRPHWRRSRRLCRWLLLHTLDVYAVLAALNLAATVAVLLVVWP
jgi:hypothetical protein